MDLTWHPSRPIIASCSASGVIYIWNSNFVENWSAFAPEFKELEENEEYIEHEDELDFVEEEKEPVKGKLKAACLREQDNIVVDITTIEKRPHTDASDDEDGEQAKFHLKYLPTIPEQDIFSR